jgi:HAD superfamily hydrolase (TIGR01459 family)
MSLAEIAANYDAFIIDLWGVMHDGTALYPGAAEALASLKKPVVFLSNAPRQSTKAQDILDKLGVKRTYYKALVTSGQIAHDRLKAERTFSKYYYLGPSKDEDILADLPAYKNVPLEEAEFVLNTGYEYDFQPHSEVRPVLKKLIDHNLTLFCVNPDMEVVKQDGTHMLCAGTLAAAYARMGGMVEYIGKPHANAYDVAKHYLPEGAILMIGDNPDTDIAGAVGASIDSLLITGGVLKVKHGKILTEAEARVICPDATHILPAFSL